MAAAIGLRDDYGSGGLRAAAKRSKDGPQARRLLALAAIYDGATRTEAAKIGGVGLQVVRDWVVKFNAQGPNGLIDRKAPGRHRHVNELGVTERLIAGYDDRP
jgi:transposase